MRHQPGAQSRRPRLLWTGVLWLLVLGGADLWRSITLWQTRRLLAELGSSLSLLASALLGLAWALSAAALIASAVGLWLRRDWARHPARAAVVAHFGLIETYTWAFVRTGLLWERRWSALALAVLATAVSLVALTWTRSRGWLGLHQTKSVNDDIT